MQDSHSKTKDGKTRGQIYKKILGLRQTFEKLRIKYDLGKS